MVSASATRGTELQELECSRFVRRTLYNGVRVQVEDLRPHMISKGLPSFTIAL